MNNEIYFTPNDGNLLYSATGEYVIPNAKRIRKFNILRILTCFFCCFSVISYSSLAYAVSENIISSEFTEKLVLRVLDKEAKAPASSQVPDYVIEYTPKEDAKEDRQENEGFAIRSADLSCDSILSLANETAYSPDMLSLSSVPSFAEDEESIEEGPAVLIIHTHATECYTAEGVTSYTSETSFRSSDRMLNMIAVGDALASSLSERGIQSIHCTELFDESSYIDSYSKSAEAVIRYKEEYPTIRYVLDVHRDAIFKSDMTLLAPKTHDGSAQVMLVCGTDEMGADFPDWENNLSFALSVQSSAQSLYPDMMRNINLRGPSFNEQLAEKYLLVEIGSAGNTLAEAKEAAHRFGEVFAAVIAD